MRKIYFILVFFSVLVFSCDTKIKPKDMCIHYGDQRCGELDSGEEVALWCDGDQWRAKEYCGKNGVCVLEADWRGAHCVY